MKTETLINALRILTLDIQSDDGVANSVVAQAANELEDLVKQRDDLIKLLERVVKDERSSLDFDDYKEARQAIAKAKGEK